MDNNLPLLDTFIPVKPITASNVQVVGDYAYVNGRSGGNYFVVLDVSDPVNPVYISNFYCSYKK